MTRIMLSCMLGITATTVSAQKLASGAVSIDSVKTHTTDGRVYISFRLNLDSLTLKPEQQLIFTPLLTAAGDTATLAPIIINGRSQQLRYERNHRATRKRVCRNSPLNEKNHKALTFPSQGFAMSKSFCTFRP